VVIAKGYCLLKNKVYHKLLLTADGSYVLTKDISMISIYKNEDSEQELMDVLTGDHFISVHMRYGGSKIIRISDMIDDSKTPDDVLDEVLESWVKFSYDS
jgi:hypothetical protein